MGVHLTPFAQAHGHTCDRSPRRRNPTGTPGRIFTRRPLSSWLEKWAASLTCPVPEEQGQKGPGQRRAPPAPAREAPGQSLQGPEIPRVEGQLGGRGGLSGNSKVPFGSVDGWLKVADGKQEPPTLARGSPVDSQHLPLPLSGHALAISAILLALQEDRMGPLCECTVRAQNPLALKTLSPRTHPWGLGEEWGLNKLSPHFSRGFPALPRTPPLFPPAEGPRCSCCRDHEEEDAAPSTEGSCWPAWPPGPSAASLLPPVPCSSSLRLLKSAS